MAMASWAAVLSVADVAEADTFARATADVAALDGIFHAAGVLDDGLIARKTIESAQRVLAPKLAGAEAAAALGERAGDRAVGGRSEVDPGNLVALRGECFGNP